MGFPNSQCRCRIFFDFDFEKQGTDTFSKLSYIFLIHQNVPFHLRYMSKDFEAMKARKSAIWLWLSCPYNEHTLVDLPSFVVMGYLQKRKLNLCVICIKMFCCFLSKNPARDVLLFATVTVSGGWSTKYP